jgi:hypothetical protein
MPNTFSAVKSPCSAFQELEEFLIWNRWATASHSKSYLHLSAGWCKSEMVAGQEQILAARALNVG